MGCPICRSNDTQRLYEKVSDLEHDTGLTATFDKCNVCGTLFQDQLPESHTLRAMYPANYRAVSARGLYHRLKYIQSLMIARRLRADLGGPQSSILELGCGAGQFLLALRSLGFKNLCGVDWTIAPDLMGESSISFVEHDITSYVPSNPVDVIVLANVIEHIRDPQALLTRYAGYLSRQGSIILLTPNAQALSHGVFGRYWSGLHAPWHVQVFTKKALAILAGQAGFQIRKTMVDEDPGGWAISFQNWWRSRGRSRSARSGFGAGAVLALVCCAPAALLALVVGRGSSLLAILDIRAQRGDADR